MKPTEVLSSEHRVILQVLDCLEVFSKAMRNSAIVSYEDAREMLYFIQNFADRCHHGKEEVHLFPMMESRGFSPGRGPTAVMRYEHEQGRSFVRGMSEALGVLTSRPDDQSSRNLFLKNAEDYLLLLREHIEKEDHCLFPMADQALSEEDQKKLAGLFEHVETYEMPAGIHEECLSIAGRLAKKYKVTERISKSADSCCGKH